MMPECPVCNTECLLEGKFEDIFLYRCSVCDHCFTDIEHLKYQETYDSSYFIEKHKRWFSNPDINHYKMIASNIKTSGKNISLLDVGCGNGNLLRFLRTNESELSLTGIDYSLNEPVNGIEFQQGDFFTTDFGKKYDVVVSLATIEHVTDIQSFTRRLYDLCDDDGLVIISTINDRSMLYRFARLLFAIGYKRPFKQLYSRHHLNHFNFSSLKRLVEINGLIPVKLLRHNIPLAAVDIADSSSFMAFILRIFVKVIFLMGNLTGHTYLQTIICRKAKSLQ